MHNFRGLVLLNITIFKQRIKELCNKNGITQKHLCDITGKGRQFLNNIWDGKCGISDNELAIIAAELNTSPEYLRGETDDPPLADDYMREIEKSPLKRDFMKKVAAMSDSDILAIANLLKQFKGE